MKIPSLQPNVFVGGSGLAMYYQQLGIPEDIWQEQLTKFQGNYVEALNSYYESVDANKGKSPEGEGEGEGKAPAIGIIKDMDFQNIVDSIDEDTFHL